MIQRVDFDGVSGPSQNGYGDKRAAIPYALVYRYYQSLESLQLSCSRVMDVLTDVVKLWPDHVSDLYRVVEHLDASGNLDWPYMRLGVSEYIQRQNMSHTLLRKWADMNLQSHLDWATCRRTPSSPSGASSGDSSS